MNALGAYIFELRKLRGYTQQQVANEAKVTDRSVSKWEKAEHEPSASDLMALLDYLGGAWEDAVQLLRSEGDRAIGVDLARWRFKNPALTEEERAYIESLNPSQKRALIDLARQMQTQ